jgi:Tol biopolymer transport system component
MTPRETCPQSTDYPPDGRSVAFISDRGGREQPWILPLDGGEPELAADIAGKAKSAR